MSQKSSSMSGIAVAVVGIVLIVIGGAVALYQKSQGVRYSASLSNPLVVGPGIVGVILLIVGIAIRMRKAPAEKSGTTTKSQTGQT